MPIVSNSLVVWHGPHQVQDGCSERVGHYLSCPPEADVEKLPQAFYESVAALATPTTAMGSRRSTTPDRTLSELHGGEWGAASCKL